MEQAVKSDLKTYADIYLSGLRKNKNSKFILVKYA
jgi:hypothetical protein